MITYRSFSRTLCDVPMSLTLLLVSAIISSLVGFTFGLVLWRISGEGVPLGGVGMFLGSFLVVI